MEKFLTKDQIHQLNHIPTDEVIKDLEITEKELKDFEDEQSILNKNPQQNKVRLYMLGGHILNRKSLISKLKQVLESRKAEAE